MKIVILGAGAMGMLFGSYLSTQNDVTLIDVDTARIEKICKDGICVHEAGGNKRTFFPKASTSAPAADLIIVFVKAMFSRSALESNKKLIRPGSHVMTLQNGSGHEEILKEFVSPQQIIIGTTQHNSSIREPGAINHGGGGMTSIGCPCGNTPAIMEIAENFASCGLTTEVSDHVQKLIWKKLFLNASASALTAVFQTSLDYIADNLNAWKLAEQLAREAVAVANGDGMGFDADQVVNEIRQLLSKSRNGYTSIYADLRNGRKTEVEAISGSVVRASQRNGIPAPAHAFVVDLIHAMEERQ